MALSTKIVYRTKYGDMPVVFGTFTFDSSYPSGGYSVDADLLAMYGHTFIDLTVDAITKSGTYLVYWTASASLGGWISELPPYPSAQSNLTGQGGGTYSGTATGGASADLQPYPTAQTSLKSVIFGKLVVMTAVNTPVAVATNISTETVNFIAYGK